MLDNGKEDRKIHISRSYCGGNNKENHLKKARNNNIGPVNDYDINQGPATF